MATARLATMSAGHKDAASGADSVRDEDSRNELAIVTNHHHHHHKKIVQKNTRLGGGGGPAALACCCCGPSLCGLVSFFLGFLQFFSSCCFRPCCSTAAMLGGVGAIGGLLTGVVCMGVLGVLPLPIELTKNICDLARNNTVVNIMDTNMTYNVTPNDVPMSKSLFFST